jgi:hypothetical protein
MDEGGNIWLNCHILCSQPSFTSNMEKNPYAYHVPFTFKTVGFCTFITLYINASKNLQLLANIA